MKIRFKTGFPAYEQGKAYDLPEELCTHYINAGAADYVEFVPEPPVENPKPRQRMEPDPITSVDEDKKETEDKEPGGDDEPKPKSKRTTKKKS